MTESLSGYTKEQEAIFDWATSHGFTPVTSEINDLLNSLQVLRTEPELTGESHGRMALGSSHTLNGWLKEWNELQFFSRQGNDPEHNKAKYKVRNDWRKILYCLNEAVKDNEPREISGKDEVERVARAIVRTQGLGEDDCVIHDNAGPYVGSKPRWQWYIPEAEAAIAAMSPKRKDSEIPSDDITRVYHAIDTAIEGKYLSLMDRDSKSLGMAAARAAIIAMSPKRESGEGK